MSIGVEGGGEGEGKVHTSEDIKEGIFYTGGW